MKSYLKKVSVLLLFINCLIAFDTNGQIISYEFYSYRLNNMFNANPAYAGKGEGVNVMLSAQSQNNGVSYANKNIMGGVYSKISPNQALGGKIISDMRGAFQVMKADLTYAYLLKITDEHHLNFGVNAGVLNSALVSNRIENYDMLDHSDDMLYSTYFNTTQFTVGTGLLYTFDKLEFSLALPNLISTNDKVISYMNVAAFYTFDVDEKTKVTPWLSYQNIPITKSVGALNVKGEYLEKFWLQIGYQTNRSLSVMGGYKLEKFSMGYGFNFSNSDFRTVSYGRHEICLQYQIINEGRSGKGSTSLMEIIKELDKLSSIEVTDSNKEELKAQLTHIKKALLEAEIDNSDPKNAKKVEKQLQQIEEKLINLETKLGQ